MVDDKEHLDQVAKAFAAANQQKAAAETPVARIEIVMLADGNVQAKCSVPNRQVLLMLLEVAKFDLERAMYEKGKKGQTGIEVPNHGVLVAQGG